MPDHVFDGAYPTTYPESKDAQGRNLGTVQPGEIRDTDGPLDHQWREATDEDRAAWEQAQARDGASEGEPPGAADETSGGDATGSDDGTEAGGGQPGAQPAAPAVIPGA